VITVASTQTFPSSPGAAETDGSASLEPWARMLVDAAGVGPGDRVLDVACGSGIVARIAVDRAGAGGSVVGLDRDPAVLALAERLRPDVEWRRGDALGLPFLARSFDVVLCQASLMYFSDTGRALREMARAIKDDGTVAIHVWDRLDDQPAHRLLVDVVSRSAGEDATDLLRSSFSLGDLSELQAVLRAAGLWPAVTRTRSTALRFGSVEEFVAEEVQHSSLGERLAGAVLEGIIDDTRDALRPFTSADGTLDVPIRGHVIAATLRARHVTGARRIHAGAGTRHGSADHARSAAGRSTTRRPAGGRGTAFA
jgi:ubiquinone/menaquinone biosynthesis C-methylase UbiE